MSRKNPKFEEKAVNALSNDQLYSSRDIYTEGGKVENDAGNAIQSSTIYTEGGSVSPPQVEQPTTSVPKRQKSKK